MATSKELRLKIRHRYDGCYNLTGWDDDVIALLIALDAEEKERQAHAERLVGMADLQRADQGDLMRWHTRRCMDIVEAATRADTDKPLMRDDEGKGAKHGD